MQVHFFPSSRRLIRTLMEIEPEYTMSLPEETFKRKYEKELGKEILRFIDDELHVRQEKVNFLETWRKEIKEFKANSTYILYLENDFPQSFYFREFKDRVELRKNIVGYLPRTDRDFGSAINPALSIFPKILNSYKIDCIILSITPLGLVPYDVKTLQPLINIQPFSSPNLFNYSETEQISRYLRIRAELMGKIPPKDSNLDKTAFIFEYKGKKRPISWGEIEKKCIKMAMRDFINISKIFLENNEKHKPILFMSQKKHLKELRELLKKYNLYDEELDVVEKFLKKNAGNEEYIMWGIASPPLIGKSILDVNGVEKFYCGGLERTIREKINNRKIEVFYGNLLTGVLRDKKLLRFFENWLDPKIDSVDAVHAEPVLCKNGSPILDYNDKEFCSVEKYRKWREKQNNEDVVKMEKYVIERGIHPWTYIIQLIQSKIEKELYPPKIPRLEPCEEKSDYHFSDFNRTPVENIVRNVLEDKIKEKKIITSSGAEGTIKEFAIIGKLMHEARRFCSVSCHDIPSFTEVWLKLNVSFKGQNYTISGISDIILETMDGALHICDTKLEASYFPPKGHRLQVFAEALAALQQFKKPIDSVSIFYHTDSLKRGILFSFWLGVEEQQKAYNEIGEQIFDYQQMKENPKLIPKFFEKYKNRMKDPELVKKIIEETFKVSF